MNSATTILPDDIQKLIANVVRRTRLRKAERADIERELTSHFRDGLASGKSVVQLIEAFGEAKVSARSIRAGAIAKRSPLDRTLRHLRIAVGWAFVALFALYAGSIGYLWWQVPVIRFDPMEQYLATLPKVDPQDRAWPMYKQGLIALADPIVANPPDLTATDWRMPGSALFFDSLGKNQGAAMPNQPSWAIQSKVMRQRRAGIDAIVRAANMPVLGYVPSMGPQPEDADIYGRNAEYGHKFHYFGDYYFFPNAHTLATASLFLGTDSLMSIEEGDGARFVRDIDAMIRVSHHAEEGRHWMAQYIGTQIRSRACARIIMALEWGPESLSDSQLKQLAGMLRSIPEADFEFDLSIDRISVSDFIQRAYSDDGAGNGVFNPVYGSYLLRLLTAKSAPGGSFYERDSLDSIKGTVLAPAGAAAHASRKEVTDLFDTLEQKTKEQTKRPLWQQDFSFELDMKRMFSGGDAAPPSKWAIPRMLTPGYSWCVTYRRLGESHCAAAQIAVALTEYRRAHGGAWPAQLDELVPEYLAAVPTDPWTGKPLRYDVQDGRVEVWCTAPQRKYAQGNHEPETSRWMTTPNTNVGDHWLWFRSDDKLQRWKPDPRND